MTSFRNAFNRIPEACVGRCRLTQDAVDRHGIVLTRYCYGPSTDHTGKLLGERVTVEEGVITEISTADPRILGGVACTNKGFANWVNQCLEEFETSGEEK